MNLKFLSVAFAVFSFINMPCSMAQSWVWAQNAGESANENANAVTTDASGNVYVAGSFSSATVVFGSFTLNNNTSGYTDIYLTKYDPDGNIIWARSAGGSDNDYASCITTDATGNVYVAGYFYSATITFGTSTFVNAGLTSTSDMYILKYDPSGNLLWAKNSGGTLEDRINAIKTDPSGGVIVTGSFESDSLVFGTDTIKNHLTTTDEVFIIKYDSSGNFIWASGTAGGGYDYGYALATDAGDNIYVAGSFSSTSIVFGDSSLTNTNSGLADAFLVKYNRSGTIQWARHAGGMGNDVATALGTDANGNVYVTGNFASATLTVNATTTLTNAGGYDLFVAKYNTNGILKWAKSNGGTANDSANTLSIDDSSNLVIAGNFGSNSMTFGTTTITNGSGGNYSLYIAKYDSSGNARWATTTGGAGSTVNWVATFPPGSIYLAGEFSDSTFTFGTHLLLNNTNSGTTDMFIAKYTQLALSVGYTETPEHKIAIYPNPADGNINVALNGGVYNNIGIYDCLGRIVYSTQLTGNEKTVTINTGTFKDGVYFLRAISNDAFESATFAVSR